MTLIPQFPPPPQSTDPANFDPRADVFLGAFPAFVTAANAQATENNQAASKAAASELSAALAAASAKNASDLATAAAAARRFDASVTYAKDALAWSPITTFIYRRLAAGNSATDPSQDKVNWAEVRSQPVGAEPNQTPAALSLGTLAFMDATDFTAVRRSLTESRPGDVWREYTSDTATVIKFHGFDGVVRSRTEAWT